MGAKFLEFNGVVLSVVGEAKFLEFNGVVLSVVGDVSITQSSKMLVR